MSRLFAGILAWKRLSKKKKKNGGMPRHTSQCYKYRNATVTQYQKQKCLSSIFSMENIFLKNQIILVAFSALISYHSDRKTSCSTQFKI